MFTTAEWESSEKLKTDPHSFLFSVNLGAKYPITGDDKGAIGCFPEFAAMFGTGGYWDFVIGDSNKSTISYVCADMKSFKLPIAEGKEDSSINGGEMNFEAKQIEVYSVIVRMTVTDILFRNNERGSHTD